MKKNIYAGMDPIEEIRAIRAKLNRRFKTAHELGEYLRKKYPIANPSPEWQLPLPKSRRPMAKTAKRTTTRRRKTSTNV